MFAEKLDLIMTALDLSNLELAQAVYLHPSYISKLRSGARKLPNNPAFLDEICSFLINQAIEKQRVGLITQLISVPYPGHPLKARKILSNWFSSRLNVKDFLAQVIETLPAEEWTELVPEASPDTRNISSQYFFGSQGEREAIRTFFHYVLQNDSPKSLLWYSSRPLTEIIQGTIDFETYHTLLGAIAESNCEITMIFKSSNTRFEDLPQLSNWLPLFMSGKVHSYVLNDLEQPAPLNGQFIIRETAALLKLSNPANHERSLCLSVNDPLVVKTLEEDYDELLELCTPLVQIKPKQFMQYYQRLYSQLASRDLAGRYFFKSARAPFYTLPEAVAERIAAQNPELGFMDLYAYGRYELSYSLAHEGYHESLRLPSLALESEDFAINMGEQIIHYSREDFLEHWANCLELLKTEAAYDLCLDPTDSFELTILAREKHGLMIERYKPPQGLFYSESPELTTAVIQLIRMGEQDYLLNSREAVIAYLETFLKNAREQG